MCSSIIALLIRQSILFANRKGVVVYAENSGILSAKACIVNHEVEHVTCLLRSPTELIGTFSLLVCLRVYLKS